MHITKEAVLCFAKILEEAEYTEGAYELVATEILPWAKANGTSLYEAAELYANADEEQDTSWYQLHLALLHIPTARLSQLKRSK